MSTNPFRFARASAVLGILGVAALVPSAADAQGTLDEPRMHKPVFQRVAQTDAGNGPTHTVLHGRFGLNALQAIAAVSYGDRTPEDEIVPPSVALFGAVDDSYGRTQNVALDMEHPIAAVAADVEDSGQESVVVVGTGKTTGRLEYVNWHTGLTHRSIATGGNVTSVAVGEFVPGQGVLIAVSIDGDRIELYAATPTGLELKGQISGVPTGPLSTTLRRDGQGDALMGTAPGTTSGARWEINAVDDPDTPYTAIQIGETTRPFATTPRIAQDLDAFGNRWYTTRDNGSVTINAFHVDRFWDFTEDGGYLQNFAGMGTPIALDLYGRHQRDTVVRLDDWNILAHDVQRTMFAEGDYEGGTEGAAIDVDGDSRDDLAVAQGSKLTLYRNVTTAATPDLKDEALTPSVRNGEQGLQVVTSKSFDLRVPVGTGDVYECRLDDGADWVPCVGGTSAKAFTVQSDGGHTMHVRRKVEGTDFWSDAQHIGFVVDSSVPAAPKLRTQPAAATSFAFFEVDRQPGLRYEYEVDGKDGWLPPDGSDVRLWNLQDGEHTVRFRAVDDTREVTSLTTDVTFVLDTLRPETPTQLSGPTGTTTGRTATLAFEGEPDATFECLIDDHEPKRAGVSTRIADPWQPCGSPLELRDLALGEHTVSVRQTDKAGNHGHPATWTWTVVEPTPDVIETINPKPPVTEQPAEKPAAVPAPAPAVEAPKPAAPKPVATKPEETKPVAAKLSVGAPAGKGQAPVATATGRRVAVGCAAPGAEGYRCAVTVTRGGKQVGAGRRTGAGVVPVNLDKATARKVQRLGGLKVRVTLTVKTADGETSKTQKTVRLLPKKVLVVPTDGLFAFDSAKPSKGADALAKQIAGQLDGARTITIVGHTDAKGTAQVNERLGRQRAEAFRRLLAQHDFDGKVAVESAGDTQPRASNATDSGRELNRRVEIEVRY